MVLNQSENLLNGHSSLEFIRPAASGVENVPHWLLPLLTPAPGRVIPETVNHGIPERLVVADEQTFAQGNEDLINNQPSTSKIGQFEIPHSAD